MTGSGSAVGKEQIALVSGDMQGSGLLLTARLVLTSAHLLGQQPPRAVVDGGTGAQKCTVLWAAQNEACDAALLLAQEDLVTAQQASLLADVRWGRPLGIEAIPYCTATGYPRAGAGPDGRHDTEQLVGTLKPGSAMRQGRYVLDSLHTPPRPEGSGESPWAGFSGAAVLKDRTVLGVVSGDPTQWGHSRILAVPIAGLLEDPDFCDVLRAHMGRPPELDNVGVAETGRGRYVWAPVRAVTYTSLGVLPAQPLADLSETAAYVQRDHDADLARRVSRASCEGRFLVVTGDSAAGKTHSLARALKDVLPDHLICVPSPEDDLAELAASVPGNGTGALLWLDDLNHFLHDKGLTLQLLEELARRNVAVLATLRDGIVEELPEEGGGFGAERPQGHHSFTRILRRAETVHVRRRWTRGERRRAGESSDARVIEAVQAGEAHGVAEYLAAGPQTYKVWQQANRVGGHPRGAALVSAAVALARTGASPAFTSTVLERLHEDFLEEEGGASLRPEPLSEAWAWAEKILVGVVSPLIPVDEERWKPFEYLVSEAAKRQHAAALPDSVWQAALGFVDDTRRSFMSLVASAASRFDIAAEVLKPLAEADDSAAMVDLGVVYVRLNETMTAESWFMRAAELGEPLGAHNLGGLRMMADDWKGARRWLVRAAEQGEDRSLAALGVCAARQGAEAEALEWWRKGIGRGDAGCAYEYARWLSRNWRDQEAAELLRQAADGGALPAMVKYAGILLRTEREDEANHYLAQVDERSTAEATLGDPVSAVFAGMCAAGRGDSESARYWWARARASGVPCGWEIIEARDGSSGVPAVVVDQDILKRLSEAELQKLMGTLWAGECRDCGVELGPGIPSLFVEDSYSSASAYLHHMGVCRDPRWNDTGMQFSYTGSEISWLTLPAGLPLSEGMGQTPVLFVNPSLEGAGLELDEQGSWTVSPQARFYERFGAVSLRADEPLPIVNSEHAHVWLAGEELGVSGLYFDDWTAPADSYVVDLVRSAGGIVVVITTELGPQGLAAEQAMKALWSSDSAVCAVPLRDAVRPPA